MTAIEDEVWELTKTMDRVLQRIGDLENRLDALEELKQHQ